MLTLLESSRVHSCICVSVCICARLPVAIPSPPLTPPRKGLKGTEVVLSDLSQNPSQIRKLRSFIIAGHDAPRITWECAPKSTAVVEARLFTCRRLSSLIYLHVIYSVSIAVLSDHRRRNLQHHFDDFFFFKEWLIKFGLSIMAQTSCSHIVTYLRGATARRTFTAWHHERVRWDIWIETKLNLDHLSIIASFLCKLLHVAADPATPQSLSPDDSQRKQVVRLWDFQLRHTELFMLSLRSGTQLPHSLAFYDALKSINSLMI